MKVDALASHDITYVGIIQTARASGLKEFPLPYVLTNCHNSLCAVGGTINEDDHVFGLSAARKYGGIFVPAHQAVIHQYMREMMAGCGKIVLASDSHTRYGALGTMGFGEGGPELVKQLLERTYDMPYPEIVAVYLEGEPQPGVGPHDVALALIKAVFKNGFVKNRVLEFVGPGVANLSVDFRNGIDVMTTETTCLSSIWMTDDKVKEYFMRHGRPDVFKTLHPGKVSYYDALIRIDLSRIEPMIAFPFHPSNAFTIKEANRQAVDILHQVEEEGKRLLEKPDMRLHMWAKAERGRIRVDQGVVAGCAGGTFENIAAATAILTDHSLGQGEFALSLYPASQPIFREMASQQLLTPLIDAGVTIRSAFCGPCFGAGDVPANTMLSVRHTTRNFPNREGSKPADGQIASVALMDARSIAATAINQGLLTAATEIEAPTQSVTYSFDKTVYDNRIYQGFGQPQTETELIFGPNIADWPQMIPLPDHLLLQVCSVIHDPVTTTDELIPSGETSSYRSNPLKLASFTLSRKDPEYVLRARVLQHVEQERQKYVIRQAPHGKIPKETASLFTKYLEAHSLLATPLEEAINTTALGSVIVAVRPGDGSAREQAASCQKVLGGWANIAVEYATKRYRSNVINWGMLPFEADEATLKKFAVNDLLYVPNIRQALESGTKRIDAYLLTSTRKEAVQIGLGELSSAERDIILAGCLINYYRNENT
jgi:aconitate hydratase